MSEQPDLSTLPKRMRYAAAVIDETTPLFRAEIYGNSEDAHGESSWSSGALRKRADIWEERDREAAESDALAEELGRDLAALIASDDLPVINLFGLGEINLAEMVHDIFLEIARKLIESGWRKGGSA